MNLSNLFYFIILMKFSINEFKQEETSKYNQKTFYLSLYEIYDDFIHTITEKVNNRLNKKIMESITNKGKNFTTYRAIEYVKKILQNEFQNFANNLLSKFNENSDYKNELFNFWSKKNAEKILKVFSDKMLKDLLNIWVEWYKNYNILESRSFFDVTDKNVTLFRTREYGILSNYCDHMLVSYLTLISVQTEFAESFGSIKISYDDSNINNNFNFLKEEIETEVETMVNQLYNQNVGDIIKTKYYTIESKTGDIKEICDQIDRTDISSDDKICLYLEITELSIDMILLYLEFYIVSIYHKYYRFNDLKNITVSDKADEISSIEYIYYLMNDNFNRNIFNEKLISEVIGKFYDESMYKLSPRFIQIFEIFTEKKSCENLKNKPVLSDKNMKILKFYITISKINRLLEFLFVYIDDSCPIFDSEYRVLIDMVHIHGIKIQENICEYLSRYKKMSKVLCKEGNLREFDLQNQDMLKTLLSVQYLCDEIFLEYSRNDINENYPRRQDYLLVRIISVKKAIHDMEKIKRSFLIPECQNFIDDLININFFESRKRSKKHSKAISDLEKIPSQEKEEVYDTFLKIDIFKECFPNEKENFKCPEKIKNIEFEPPLTINIVDYIVKRGYYILNEFSEIEAEQISCDILESRYETEPKTEDLVADEGLFGSEDAFSNKDSFKDEGLFSDAYLLSDEDKKESEEETHYKLPVKEKTRLENGIKNAYEPQKTEFSRFEGSPPTDERNIVEKEYSYDNIIKSRSLLEKKAKFCVFLTTLITFLVLFLVFILIKKIYRFSLRGIIIKIFNDGKAKFDKILQIIIEKIY